MASSKKLNFAPLRKVMDQIDDNGRHGRCGNWEMGLGGYDMGYEIYYRGAPIGRVNYGDKEYELYDEDFMSKELVPEFLAAIDARRFQDVGYHEQDDEFIDDEDGEMMQESGESNLETFLSEKEREFEPSGVNPSWDLSEDKVWAVQDYLSMMGEFTDEDREYLRQTAPELLSLEENEDDGQDMVNEARKQIMWAINFRNMRTAVHGMYYGKDRKRVEEFAKQLEYIQKDCLDVPSEEYPFMFDDLFADYPDIKCEEEIDWHDIVDLPGGYEGIETDDTIYRFVNRVSLDLDMVFGESTRKQKMKFSKIMKEADEGKNYTDDTPKIYVGTYAKYNDGSIDGKWIDLTEYDTYEDFVAACRELHSDESDPEFMVQDYENFPEKWYHEGGLPTEEEFDKINEFYMMDDSKKEAYEVFVNYTGLDSIEDFEEAYVGQFNSPEDFGYYAVDTWGIPDNPEYYIDYESFGRDLTMDWHQGDPDETDAEGEPEDSDYYYDSEGYQQMEYGSDSEVGEQYIDDIGFDSLGTDTLNNYFDYEEYGRTLLVNDFWEDSGYIFSEI